MFLCWARKPTMTFPQSFGDPIGKIPNPEKVANDSHSGCSTRDRLYICGHTSLWTQIHVNTRGAQGFRSGPLLPERTMVDVQSLITPTAASRSLPAASWIGPKDQRHFRPRPARASYWLISTKKRPSARRRKCVVLGLHVTAIVAHVADEASVDLMVRATLEREGRLDILANNAGIAIRRPAVDLALGDWDKVLSVKMTGSFLCGRRRARPMIAAESRRRNRERGVDHGPVGRRLIPTWGPIRRPRARSSI